MWLWDSRTHKRLGQPLKGGQGPRRRRHLQPDWADARGHRPQRDGTALGHPHAQAARPAPGRPPGSVNGVAFSPDGRTLAAAGENKNRAALGHPHGQAARPTHRLPGLRLRRRLQPGRADARLRRPRRNGTALGHPHAESCSANPWTAATAPSKASPSARTGACSPPAATTERYGSGTAARSSRSANRCAATAAPSTASPSAETGARSPPAAMTGRCGSGKASSGATSMISNSRYAACSSATSRNSVLQLIIRRSLVRVQAGPSPDVCHARAVPSRSQTTARGSLHQWQRNRGVLTSEGACPALAVCYRDPGFLRLFFNGGHRGDGSQLRIKAAKPSSSIAEESR